MKVINEKHYIIVVIITIAILNRTLFINQCPSGIHADEAYAGYEAWSMLNYGTDSFGYANPVYLTVWGDGMSILNSVLMMPFVSLFGLNVITVKIPVIIMGIISVYVFYLLLKKVSDERMALWGSGLVAISPWHIMISRYGMDANLAPALVLIAMYLTVLGIENNKKLIWAAIAWGISLYAYVVLWIFVPVFLALTFIYCIRYKKITEYRHFLVAIMVLFVIAVPLLLFVCVNIGFIPEIRTDIISIPKLLGFRTNELGVGGFVLNIKRIFKCFVLQSDGYMWNSIPFFGVYYILSTPISAVGLVVLIKKSVRSIQEKRFCYEVVLLFWMIAAIIMAFTQTTGTNLTRINAINFAMFIVVIIGIKYLIERITFPKVEQILIAIYAISFMCFMSYYLSIYKDAIAERQFSGADKALEYAIEHKDTGQYGEKIGISCSLSHSQVLFYTKFPTDEYIRTVKYSNMVNGKYYVKSFGGFEWIEEGDSANIYVIDGAKSEEYEQKGYDVEIFGECAVAIKQDR